MTADEILRSGLALMQTKAQDYSSDPTVNRHENFDRCAEIAGWFTHDIDKVYATFIAVKLARLATLLNKTGQPNHEAIVDTFMDMANYAALWGGKRTPTPQSVYCCRCDECHPVESSCETPTHTTNMAKP